MTYLRVKKWRDWQHYKDRDPPWVKLHAALLRDDKFLELTELAQWQLVRVWMVVSKSTRFTLDEQCRQVPVVMNDESTIRRATATLKRVPLPRFIDAGWLIEVAANETFDASTVLAKDSQKPAVQMPEIAADASALLEAEKQRFRGLDKPQSRSSALPNLSPVEEPKTAPFGSEARLFEVLTDMDENSAKVLRPLLELLPAASVEFTRNEVVAKQPRRPTGYAVEVLTRQIETRNAARARREAAP